MTVRRGELKAVKQVSFFDEDEFVTRFVGWFAVLLRKCGLNSKKFFPIKNCLNLAVWLHVLDQLKPESQTFRLGSGRGVRFNLISFYHFTTRNQLHKQSPHSHSIVAGGLLEMSKHTRLTPLTSLMMRLESFSSRSYGSFTQSAVMPSCDSTARIAMV